MESTVELLQELQGLQHIGSWGDKIGHSEVICAFYLPEATARDGHDACFLDHRQAVHCINWHSLFCSCLDGLLGEGDSRKAVHSSFNSLAGNLFHLIECISQNMSTLTQPVGYGCPLLFVLRNACR